MERARDRIDRAEGFHGRDLLAVANELQQDLDRNVITSWLGRWQLRRAIRRARRGLAAAERLTDRGIALRQAVAAERSAFVAWLALVVSIAALALSIWVLMKPPAS